MKILKLNRQHLEDLCGYFVPFMIRLLESRVSLHSGTEAQMGFRIGLSVMNDIEKLLQKKYLGDAHKFKIKFSEAQAIILLELMLQFPIAEDHFWRLNLRNNIVEQLHKQLV